MPVTVGSGVGMGWGGVGGLVTGDPSAPFTSGNRPVRWGVEGGGRGSAPTHLGRDRLKT